MSRSDNLACGASALLQAHKLLRTVFFFFFFEIEERSEETVIQYLKQLRFRYFLNSGIAVIVISKKLLQKWWADYSCLMYGIGPWTNIRIFEYLFGHARMSDIRYKFLPSNLQYFSEL